mmetsp:Transcript_106157/g.269623  ORF Transcript_106157/g.269623 Transcript_106157/m.269623 type:complete len:92 (-) Transcript_106157:25-300(-)
MVAGAIGAAAARATLLNLCDPIISEAPPQLQLAKDSQAGANRNTPSKAPATIVTTTRRRHWRMGADAMASGRPAKAGGDPRRGCFNVRELT